MFITQNKSFAENEILDLIKSNDSTTVLRPIPSLVRERNGKAEYLLIGQKIWQSLPEGFVEEAKISHIQHFSDAEPLIVVYLHLTQPKTPVENMLLKMFISTVTGNGSGSAKVDVSSEECSCHGKEEAVHTTARSSCAGCTYCGPCEPGYCYRSCYCYGAQDWCYDRVCGGNC